MLFDHLARLVDRHGWVLVAAWALFAAALFATAPSWNSVSRDDDVRFFPPGFPTVRGQELLERGFPGEVSGSTVVLIVERPDEPLRPEDRAYVEAISQR